MIKGMTSDAFDNGFNQIQIILDLITNKDLYAQQLKELDKKKKELTKLIKAVGSVNTIHEIREQAEQERQKIVAELVALKDKKDVADIVISEAHTRARTIEADAASRNRDQKNVLDLREKELLANRAQLNEREEEFRKSEEGLRVSKLAANAELDRLTQLQELANNARMDYEDRRQQIEKAIAGV